MVEDKSFLTHHLGDLNPKMKEMFPLWSMGETAEEVASLLKIHREEQDKFALESENCQRN